MVTTNFADEEYEDNFEEDTNDNQKKPNGMIIQRTKQKC